MSKFRFALPLLAAAALLGVLWFAFRDHVLQSVASVPVAAAPHR